MLQASGCRAGTALAMLICLWAGPAAAGPVRSFRVTSYKDLSEGEAQGVMLSSRGEVVAGWGAERLALPSLSDDSVRALVAAPDGAVYLGTGGDSPRIYLYERGTLRLVAQLPASTWVTALCILPARPGQGAGELLAATAQDGRIFQVSRTGQVRLFGRVEAEHVWALLYDARRDRVLVAGGPGRVFALERNGRVQPLVDTGARQVLGLAQGDDGQLYLGTANDAVLYRLDPDRPGSLRALHDFAGTEVRAVVWSRGVLYVAVNDMQREAPPRPGVRIALGPAGAGPGSGGGKAGPTDRGKGALYRIEPSGQVEQIHAISDGFWNALQVDGDGQLFAAASTPGGRGRLYWVRPDRTVLTALELKESDLLALSFGKERLVGTGNSGALYRLKDTPAKGAHYLSKVLDAQAPARWGTLRYVGQGTLRLETRSGNVARPDATWSPWEPLARPEPPAPTGEIAGKVASPPGRYLQVRATLADRASVLQDFTIAYQPINQRARVLEVQVGEDPLGHLARAARPGGGKPRQPVVKIRWKVDNPDEDELVYRVYVRPLRARPDPTLQPGWLLISGPEPLSRTELDWNTETVADGAYEARVVASDERSNPAETALSDEMITPPFLVDNRRPELQEVKYNPIRAEVTGRAADATSPLGELSYAVDGGDFLPLAPRDGILDDPIEEFTLRLPRLGPGPHVLVLRAIDAADNVALLQLVVQGR
ncbi:MAG: hypothetical protein RMK29_05740 [Myxococcales bacterium]|nr:hypothetical protein [Myxococcales bacterium]